MFRDNPEIAQITKVELTDDGDVQINTAECLLAGHSLTIRFPSALEIWKLGDFILVDIQRKPEQDWRK